MICKKDPKLKDSRNTLLKSEPPQDKNNLIYTLEKIQNNVFHIQTQNQLSESIVNYFTIAVGLFMFGCIHADIIYSDGKKSFFYGNIIIVGIAQIGLGIYDWYKGKSLTLLMNISLGFLFVSWFFTDYYDEERKDKEGSEGLIYILWALLGVAVIIGVKNKGILYSLDYLVLVVGFVFVCIDKYANQDWAKKTYGYIFIVGGALFWITGLLRFISNSFMDKAFFLVKE